MNAPRYRDNRWAARARSRPGFSLIELLMALAISATLLTAALSAFDASWRGYKQVTEAASSHVVSRIVTHRVLAMLRTGTQFGPFPADVLNAAENPLTSTFIEFIAESDRLAGNGRVTRIERRNGPTGAAAQYELWYVLLDSSGSTLQQRPLLGNVREAHFTLEYQPGPRLVRATIDFTVLPRDDEDTRVGIGSDTPCIRLVASAVPRQWTEQ